MKLPAPSALTRREFVRTTSVLTASALAGGLSKAAAETTETGAPSQRADFAYRRPFLTPADKFRDVSRGNPKPYTLKGEALVRARLTPETWRLEITADETLNAAVKEQASLRQAPTLAYGDSL